MSKQKQKKVLNEMVANGGVLEPAVRKHYSVGYARSGKIVKTKSWQELLEQELPDGELVKVHKEGLAAVTNKPQLVDRDDKGRPIYEYVPENDYGVRHKYLQTAYQIKGKVKEEISNSQSKTIITNNFFISPKIQEATKAYDEILKEAIANEIKPETS